MEMPLAEIRLKCVSLVYRHGMGFESTATLADQVFKWVTDSPGQSPEATPKRRGQKPKTKPET